LQEWLRDLALPTNCASGFMRNRNDGCSFRKRHLKELARPEALTDLQKLYTLAHKRKPHALYASRTSYTNNANVLKDLLDGMRKPPTGHGPRRASGDACAETPQSPRR